MYETVLSFFISVLKKEPEVLSRLNDFEGDISLVMGQLRFSLAGLKLFLFDVHSITDQDFQQLLYGSYLNQDLARLGGRVDVFESRGKLAKNYYCLVLLPASEFSEPC